MTFELRPPTPEERKYCFLQRLNLRGPTGAICKLSSNIDDTAYAQDVFGMYSHASHFSLPEFQAQLAELLSYLKHGVESCCVLRDIRALSHYCESHPDSFARNYDGAHGFCYSAWTDAYAFMMLLNQESAGHNQVQIQCYRADILKKHIASSREGILFIDMNENVLFHIHDDDSIRLLHNPSRGIPDRILNCRVLSGDPSLGIPLFDIGGMEFTAKSFAELIAEQDLSIWPVRSSLPEVCFWYDSYTRKVMQIRKAEPLMQISAIQYPEETAQKVEETVAGFNASLGLTDAQIRALVHGGRFDWSATEADPDFYR